MESSPIFEIVVQICWFSAGVALLYFGLQENKKAIPLSWKDLLTDKYANMDALVRGAGPIVIGAGLLFFLAYKLISCGFVCWS
jgi:hypothetical protein